MAALKQHSLTWSFFRHVPNHGFHRRRLLWFSCLPTTQSREGCVEASVSSQALPRWKYGTSPFSMIAPCLSIHHALMTSPVASDPANPFHQPLYPCSTFMSIFPSTFEDSMAGISVLVFVRKAVFRMVSNGCNRSSQKVDQPPSLPKKSILR